MESNKPESQRIIKVNMRDFEERRTSNLQIITAIDNVVNELVKFGRENRKITKENLKSYFNEIQTKIIDLNNSTKICQFLIEEKRKFQMNIIEAKIQKDGYIQEDLHSAIEVIIEPLLKHWLAELEFDKNMASLEKVTSSSIKMNPDPLKTIDPISEVNSDFPALRKEYNPISDRSKQIQCSASKEEILNFFMILAKEKNNINNKLYMEEHDVDEFVKRNFSIFNSEPIDKFSPINLLHRQKSRLVYFIYKFYTKFERGPASAKMKYVNLLINNFEMFNKDKPLILITNMSESKKPVKSNSIPIPDNIRGKPY